MGAGAGGVVAHMTRAARDVAQAAARLDRRLEWIEKGWIVLINVGLFAAGLGALSLLAGLIAWWR
jgi:hypothetical protein